MTVDPFSIVAILLGGAALVFAVWRQRNDDERREQRAAASLTREQQLEKRVAMLERDITGLQRMLVEKQNEIDQLNQRIRQLEQGAAPSPSPAAQRRVLVVGVGEDVMLQEDLAQLRRVQALRISRLLPVSMANLERTVERHRAAGNPVKLLHLAVHSNAQGLVFADGVATGLWLSQHLAGVDIMVLAGCEGDQVADLLRVVPAVVSMREAVSNRDAAIFAGAFWSAVGSGMNASDAFEYALDRAPATLAEFVELHL